MVPYKVGDSKVWKGKTYYYCDTTLHNNRIKRHKHKPATCRTRIHWLESKKKKDRAPDPTANIGETKNQENEDSNVGQGQDITSNANHQPSDIQAMLASVLTHMSDSGLAKDLIADAISILDGE